MVSTVAVAVADREVVGFRSFLAFFAMVVGMFLAVLNIQIVGSSFADIQAGLAAGPDEISWVLTAALIAETIMIPLSGWLSRLMSTRILFTLSASGFAAASLACAFAWDIDSMIVFRALQGFSGGAMAPMVFATVYSVFPRRYQNVLIAIVSLLGTSAVAIGPSVGGWISESLSWHWLFLISVPFGVFSAIVVGFLVDFDRPDWKLARVIDIPGIMLIAVFFMSLLTVLEEGRREDWFASDFILGLSAVTVISGVLLLWRELTAANPVVDLRVFANRNFAVGAFYICVFGAGLFVPLFLLPLFLARIEGLNTAQIGSMLFVLGLAMMFAGFIVPFLLRIMRRRTVATMGFALLALGTLAQANLNEDTAFYELLLPQVLRGFAGQLCFLPMIGLAIGLLPAEQVKNATGLFQLTMRLGGAVGVAVANSYLVIRSQVNYAQIRDMIAIGGPLDAITVDRFSSLFAPLAGAGPGGGQAGLDMLVRLSERDAVTHAFNEITTVVAIAIAMLTVFLPFAARGREG